MRKWEVIFGRALNTTVLINRDGKVAKRAGKPEDLPQENSVSQTSCAGLWTQNGLRIKKGNPQAERSVWGFFVKVT